MQTSKIPENLQSRKKRTSHIQFKKKREANKNWLLLQQSTVQLDHQLRIPLKREIEVGNRPVQDSGQLDDSLAIFLHSLQTKQLLFRVHSSIFNLTQQIDVCNHFVKLDFHVNFLLLVHPSVLPLYSCQRPHGERYENLDEYLDPDGPQAPQPWSLEKKLQSQRPLFRTRLSSIHLLSPTGLRSSTYFPPASSWILALSLPISFSSWRSRTRSSVTYVAKPP